MGVGPSSIVAKGARPPEGGLRSLLIRGVLAGSRLKAGEIAVMDNLGAHRPKRISELAEARGCELLYLPLYSSDLNPIEEGVQNLNEL